MKTTELVGDPVSWPSEPASRTVPAPVPLNTSCWYGFANPRLLVIVTVPDPLFVMKAGPVAASKVIGLPPIVTVPDPAMPDGFEKFRALRVRVPGMLLLAVYERTSGTTNPRVWALPPAGTPGGDCQFQTLFQSPPNGLSQAWARAAGVGPSSRPAAASAADRARRAGMAGSGQGTRRHPGSLLRGPSRSRVGRRRTGGTKRGEPRRL